MAVVSISRIQIRRGKEQSGSGLPQLASGELGWAIDTQNLYIGNGSVSEGAPAVGNTKILTENDNLFDLPNIYTYRTGSSIAGTVTRNLQDRLDDRVSVRAFGVVGDGVTDDTVALQTAIYQLFLNTTVQDRAILYIEPGEYLITGTIYLPKNTRIVGAGIDKTVIKIQGTTIGFITVSDLSTAEVPVWTTTVSTSNQPSNIYMSGMTIENIETENDRPMIHLWNCKDSVFDSIKFSGNYNTDKLFSNVDGFNDPIVSEVFGIQISSDSRVVYTSSNTISNCVFENLFAGVYSDAFTLNNLIESNNFENCIYGIGFGLNVPSYEASNPYPNNNTILDNKFDEIYANGLAVLYGVDNISKHNKFYNVGNRYAGPAAWTAVNTPDFFSNIRFDYTGNFSVDDWIERQYILSTGRSRDNLEQVSLTSTVFIPSIEGPVMYKEGFTNSLTIQDTTSPVNILRFAADTDKTYEIEYSYKSQTRTFYRFGKLTISIQPTTQQVNIIDDYDITGDSNYAENIVWASSFANNDTVVISSTNPGDTGTLMFTSNVKS